MQYAVERQQAVQAVLHASRLCEAVRAELVTEHALAKADRSPVTVADFGAQAVVHLELQRAFPEDPLVAEEDPTPLLAPGATAFRQRITDLVRRFHSSASEAEILAAIGDCDHPGGAVGRQWVLDPLDGTKGFLGHRQYAVALALVEDGRVVLGVLGCPRLPARGSDENDERGSLFVAVRDQGAAVRTLENPQETAITAAITEDPRQAVFCEPFESAHSAHDESQKIGNILGVEAPPVRMDSQAKYAAVARGEAAIYLRVPTRSDYQEKIWDHAAGSILVEEAGGRVTDLRGRPLDFSRGRTLSQNTGIVATNGRLHDQVLAAARQTQG